MRSTLTLRQTFLYSCTSIGINLINTSISTWLLYYYAPPKTEGVQYLPVAVVGTLLAIGRVWNAIIDPWIGHWSDVTRSRWGRRKPFLIVGSLITLVSLLLLWMPPTAQPSLLNAIYFLTMTIVFYTGISLVGVPYDGSLAEVATTAAERVRLSMWKNIFGIVGVLAGAVIASVVYSRWGAVAMGAVIGVIGLVTAGLTVQVLPERPKYNSTTAMSFGQSLRATLRNQPFLILCSSTILVQTAYAMLLSNLPYFVTLILREPEAAVGRYQAIVVIAMLIAAPIWNWLSRTKRDRALLRVSLLGFALTSALLAAVGWLPNVSIELQAAIVFGILGPFFGGYFVLIYAMMGTVVEQDASVTGQRREAFHYSIFSFSVGMGLSFSTLIIPLIFSRYGYTLEHPIGVRIVFLVTAVLVMLSVVVFRGYQLTEASTER